MSDSLRPDAVRPGSGTPFTARGRSIAYAPPPWNMRGRTLALWYRLADPDEASRHVPGSLSLEPDPIVRARFWDMHHDAVPGIDGGEPRWTPFREAVVAFPVRYGDVEGDYPTYMYADEAAYTAFGREVMGWPVRDGSIDVEDEDEGENEHEGEGGPVAGRRVSARLVRGGVAIMRASLELTGRRVEVDDSEPPRWLSHKCIPHVSHPGAALSQLVVTGPERIHHRIVWEARAELSFAESPTDELHFLAPREIVSAQLWTDVRLTVGWGRVLCDLGEAGDGDDRSPGRDE